MIIYPFIIPASNHSTCNGKIQYVEDWTQWAGSITSK